MSTSKADINETAKSVSDNNNNLNENATNIEISSENKENKPQLETVFTLKRWNLVAMWSWDVECEVCAICRTPLMGNLFLFYFLFKIR